MHLTPSRSLTADDDVFYPSGDGNPLAETPIHRDNLLTLIDVLDRNFADDPLVYVSGNMFIYYEQGNNLKHVSPDVFLVRGVPKDTPRDYYQVWKEGRGPDLVIELTSASTRKEDIEHKKRLYQDRLHVREYVLFDPHGEWLDPPLQGFRLVEEAYVPIAMTDGRLPSEVTGLSFEADGFDLRIFDPATGEWLATSRELLAAAAERLERLEADRDRVAAERDWAAADNERLRNELAELRRQFGEPAP